MDSTPDALSQLEEAFKQEIWRSNKAAIAKKKREQGVSDDESARGNESEVEVIPPALLNTEKIDAKLFQHKLKRMGITLSLWEIFTLFEQLNAGPRVKMFFEPARYHAVMFSAFYEPRSLSRSRKRGRRSPSDAGPQARSLSPRSRASRPRPTISRTTATSA
jgi:hypothetical protein